MNRNKKIGWIVFFLCASLWGAPYTDNGNGTVTDSGTGLVWQKCSAGLGTTLGNCSTGITSLYSWSSAISYCEGLTLGSRSDWRLPNINELRSIVDYGSSTSPSINTTIFPNTQSNYYWSSSSYALAWGQAYSVIFTNGAVIYRYTEGAFYQYCVRCVTGP